MTILQSIILGIVEGVTEFLPISSTGHMILVAHYMAIEKTVALATFEIIVQLGAILAVIVSYHKRLFNLQLLQKLIIAFIPTGVVGVLVFPYIKHLLSSPFLVSAMLVLGGVLILFVERRYRNEINISKEVSVIDISYKHAFLLGIFQVLAIIPGVSRSGAIIVGGLTQKIPRKTLVEFSFLLAVPTMIIATLYTILKKHSELSIESVPPIIIGTVVSFVVALTVIRLALAYIRKHSFEIFGWYRIVIGTILLIALW